MVVAREDKNPPAQYIRLYVILLYTIDPIFLTVVLLCTIYIYIHI